MKNNQFNAGMIANLSKIILFILLLCIPESISIYAQSKNVQGTAPRVQQQGRRTLVGLVKDEHGDAIIGASVQVVGTETGTITNVDGLYSITIPSGKVILKVSFIGYISQEVEVGNRSNITFTLKESVKEIEEVVITAYGTGQKKAKYGGID